MTRDEALEENKRAVAANVAELARDAARRGEMEYAAPLISATNLALETNDFVLLDGVLAMLRRAVEIKDRQARIEFTRDEGARLLHEARTRGKA